MEDLVEVPGQIVLVKSEATKPFQWPLGHIESVYPDAEGDGFQGCVRIHSDSTIILLLDG